MKALPAHRDARRSGALDDEQPSLPHIVAERLAYVTFVSGGPVRGEELKG